MKKIYIIDTSVLVYDPNSYQSFPESEIILPINVLDECDKLKKFPGEIGKNARMFIRTLDSLCKEGELHKGITLKNKTILKVDVQNYLTEDIGDDSYTDNKIIACAVAIKNIKRRGLKPEVIVVSKDINLRLRARAYELGAEDYEKDVISSLELYSGLRTIENEKLGTALDEKDEVEISLFKELSDLMPNEFIHVVNEFGDGLALGRRIGNKVRVVSDRNPWTLDAKNKEQACAIDMLLDPKISLVSLVGMAGCGKSLIALACGLDQVLERKMYNKFMIYRPFEPVGRELGFTPGTIQEKLEPWLGPINDGLDLLFDAKSNKKNGTTWRDKISPQYLERIDFAALTYIRGRSIPNSFILIDEFQNLTVEDAKTILTRSASGSKIVITGDIEQIDSVGLDANNNGLTHIIEKFKGSPLAGHITMIKGERSALAEASATLL